MTVEIHEDVRARPTMPSVRQWEQMSPLDRAETALRYLEHAVRHENRQPGGFSVGVKYGLNLADLVLHREAPTVAEQFVFFRSATRRVASDLPIRLLDGESIVGVQPFEDRDGTALEVFIATFHSDGDRA